jgi:hypothetical protein
MAVPPNQWPRILHDGQKPRQVVYFSVGVSPVNDPTEIKQLSTLIQLAPEPVL